MPLAFRDSYAKCKNYPRNLIAQSLYGVTTLEISYERYHERQSTLLVGKDDTVKVKIPVRDISRDGSVTKENILTLTQLRAWLGDETAVDPSEPGGSAGGPSAKSDPACRFVFLVTASQTSAPLEISASFLSRVLTWHQVMPCYLDFLYVYGNPCGEDREIRYSGFRSEKVLVNPAPGNVVDRLERTGRRYQICYNLKAVALKDTAAGAIKDKIWKIRQAAVHHQFDVGSGTQLWIIADPHAALKDRVGKTYPETGDHVGKFDCMEHAFHSSLEVHLLYCRWSTEEWRNHLRSLEEIIDRITIHLLGPGEELDEIELNAGAVGEVQEYEDISNEAVMALESNAEIMTRLKAFYDRLVKDEDFPQRQTHACQKMVNRFSAELDELVYEVQMHIARGRVLAKVASDRKMILIQHLQAQSSKRQERFTAVMLDQAERSENEAVAMRIITVITLFYLPATFASTLFSTDIVRYQNGGGGGDTPDGAESFSWLALQRWLELSLPLMVVTFLGVMGWYWWEGIKRKRRQKAWPRVNLGLLTELKEKVWR